MDLPLNDTALWKLTVQEQEVTLPVASATDAGTDLSQKFSRLFFATKDRLYQFVWKLTQHETDTKDIIQNCYAQLWQKIATVDDSRDVLPLLFTYARNLVIDHLRKKARHRKLMDQLQRNSTPAEATPQAEQLMHFKEQLQQLQSTIDLLPAKRKRIFTLVKQEGLSHKKVADQLGISPATVEKQVGLSLKFLRKELGY
ncbi:sigma-70 family RNA polymerase sigma factor [Niastella caeni]|uniref:Sigma-70 family RNA polymerase sigma factor n=1 Tax=Niastella caeni TaxID=2569763 RepID=A0A4S8HG59_9BACT|nr:sigma-70 family RNA polymerase sigma factor [Niastella caeni]THU33461.1 sigma-70 family RNA polymerase sigma factor [Niastella caeni]